ncbi:MAG: hypothetical protein WBM44_02870 [Waterburya sp.]
MKLLLFKTLLQRRAKDEGFTLPIVIALGLIMILLGLVNITGASEENLTAISKNSSTDSLAVAEIGIARYRELLDTNRVLALYNVYTQPDDIDINRWAGAGTATGAANIFGIDSVCSADIDTFANRTVWHDVTLSEANAGADFNRDGDQSDMVNMGQYRLVSYVYDIDGDETNEDTRQITLGATNPWVSNFSQTDDSVNTNDNVAFNDVTYNPRGILTVQGRTSVGADGVDSSQNNITQDNERSFSQIQVEIPIRLNQQDVDNLAPALWIGDGNVGSLGNLTVADGNDPDTISDTNIVVRDQAQGVNPGCINPPDNLNGVTGVTNNIISDPREIPPIQPVLDTITAAGGAQTNNTLTPILGRPAYATPPNNDRPYVEPDAGNVFVDYENRDGATGDWDCKNISDCRYYYDLPGGTTINAATETDGISKVTLYVRGDLNINADIGSEISSNYLEIYATGNVNITTGGGVIDINALIHAPDGTLTITGGGNVNFGGSVWVNEFINNGGTIVTIDPDITDSSSTASDRSYKFYTTTTSRVPRPLTTSPTNWQIEEVQP